MDKLSTNSYKSNSGITNLKLVLFIMFAFSFGIGTAQADNCPDLGSSYSFQSASIEGNHDTGDVVSCHYISKDLSQKEKEKTIKSSDYVTDIKVTAYYEAVEGYYEPWRGEDKLMCGPNRMKCTFNAMDHNGIAYASIFPNNFDLNSQ